MDKVIGGMTLSLDGFAGDSRGDVSRLYPDLGVLRDELHIGIMPILLGDGLRLFEPIDVTQVTFEKIKMFEAGQRTDIWFRIVR